MTTRPTMTYRNPYKRAVTLEEARADGMSPIALRNIAAKYRCHIGDDLRRVAQQLAAENDNRARRMVG